MKKSNMKKRLLLLVPILLMTMGCESELEKMQRETRETLIGDWEATDDEVITFKENGKFYGYGDGELDAKGTYELYFINESPNAKKIKNPNLTEEERKTAKIIESLRQQLVIKNKTGTIPVIELTYGYPKSNLGEKYKISLDIIDKNKILLNDKVGTRVNNYEKD